MLPPSTLTSLLPMIAVLAGAHADVVAPPASPGSGPARIAVGGGLLAWERAGEVVVPAADVRAPRRPTGGAEPPQAPHVCAPRRGGATEQARLLDALDVDPEHHDSPEAEVLLEEERGLRGIRGERLQRATPAAPHAPTLLAAAGDGLLVATSRGLWALTSAGAARRIDGASRPPDALAGSPAGAVAVVREGRIEGAPTATAPFASIARVGGPIGALALDATGARIVWALAGTTGVRLAPLRAEASAAIEARPTRGAVRDVQFCGDRAVALTDVGIESPGAEDDSGPMPLVARRLVCPAGPGVWVAVGPGLHVSRDGGRSWADRSALVPGGADDAALAPAGVWVVGPQGLELLSWAVLLADPAAAAARPEAVEALEGAVGLGRPGRPAWAPLLPRVSLQGMLSRGVRRTELGAVLLADFALGPPPAPSSSQGAGPPVAGAPPPSVSVAGPALPPLTDQDRRCLAAARVTAVRHAQVEPERARSYLRRARLSGWLPELRVRVDRRLGRSESVDLGRVSASGLPSSDVDEVDDVRYEARATWDLGRLVFAPEELAAQAQAARMADARREIETLVNRLFFERRRLMIHQTTPSLDDDQDRGERRALRLEETEAELDALTGGALSRCLGTTRAEGRR